MRLKMSPLCRWTNRGRKRLNSLPWVGNLCLSDSKLWMGNPYMMLSHKSEGSSPCTCIRFPFLKSFPKSLSASPYYLSASAVCSKLSPPSSPPIPQKRFRKVGQIKHIASPEALVTRMWRKPLWCHRLHFEMLNIKECKHPAYFLIFFFPQDCWT